MLVLLALTFKLQKGEVLIESIESKTYDGHPVFNKISYFPGKDKDIWKMQQSHTQMKGEWDQIQIIIDKTKKPYQAYYSQLKNGNEIEYKMSCFKCHANGPRMIRANFHSKKVKYSLQDKLTIFWWNLKIKHYGEIVTPQDLKLGEQYRKVFLKYTGRVDNRIVTSQTCNLCHGKESFMGRAPLLKQHAETIKHLIETKQMPPWPLSLSKKEKEEIYLKLDLI